MEMERGCWSYWRSIGRGGIGGCGDSLINIKDVWEGCAEIDLLKVLMELFFIGG